LQGNNLIKDMTYQYFCGWDISKLTLNYCLHDLQGRVVQEGQIKNSSSAIAALVKQLHTRFSIAKGAILHSAENTGQYAHPLCQTSAELHFPLWLEDAFQLNRSMGRRREKNDRIDARGIAEYTRRFTDKAKLYELPSKFQLKMEHLAKVRQHILGNAQRSKTMFQEMQQFSLVPIDTRTVEIFNEHLQQMKHQLELIEQQIEACIAEADPFIQRKIAVARSVPGIGPKNSIVILVITGLFERIPSARKCASYAGISPHERQSGTTLRQRFRASRSASRSLKTAFHQGAMSLIQGDNLFNQLYRRLRAKGRSHKQAINAVRNKIIKVLYACLGKDTMYCKKYHQNLQGL
jgi:transposase